MKRKSNLHPSVQQFKQFVKSHPELVKEVRQNRKTWQELFEEWTLLGEEHDMWEQYKIKDNDQDSETMSESTEEATNETNNPGQSESLSNLLGLIKNINFNDLQHHLSQFSGVLGNVQSLMQMFSQGNQGQQQQQQQQQQQSQQTQENPQQEQQNQQDHPFSFRGH
ncbi:YlbD family protein [Bacillus sp. FJAT-45350]|uniref:YlbD family protein n=1 Tax=Bacillus sp. FJAT-45350 TaxID=2011014 RepID=UPI000BB7425D|nr:YlbD family protein [Bacillus sp. FJAT-45350]